MQRLSMFPKAKPFPCPRRPPAPDSRSAHLSPSQPPHPQNPPVPPSSPPPFSPQYASSLAGPLYTSLRPSSSNSRDGSRECHPISNPPDRDPAMTEHNPTSAYPYVDASYIARYRDPSALAGKRWGRAEVKEIAPARSDKKQSNFEARRARREMEALWEGGRTAGPWSELERDPLQGGTNAALFAAKAMATAQTKTARSEPADGTPLALCFPGSGSQYIGMGSFLADLPSFHRTWEEAEAALSSFEAWRKTLGLEDLYRSLGMGDEGADIMGGPMRRGAVRESGEGAGLREVVFKGPQDELTRSSNAHPAVLITSIAFLRALEEEFSTPVSSIASYFGGHSSGECAALVAARALTFPDAVRLIRLQGLLTTRTLELSSLHPATSVTSPPEIRAQMSALLINPGRTHEEVMEVVRHVRTGGEVGKERLVEASSFNSKQQIVLSGTRKGVMEACEKLQDLGIANRAADLPVAAPFHCSFMECASVGITHSLKSLTISAPTKPLISGLTASLVTEPQTLATHLAKQIPAPVRWADSISTLRREGVRRMVFIGPGKALANLARKEGVKEGWVRDEDAGAAGAVKLRTRGGVNMNRVEPWPSAAVSQRGSSPSGNREDCVEVRSLATEADFWRVSELLARG